MTTPNYNISYQVTVFLINIEGKLLSKMRCDTVCKHCNKMRMWTPSGEHAVCGVVSSYSSDDGGLLTTLPLSLMTAGIRQCPGIF